MNLNLCIVKNTTGLCFYFFFFNHSFLEIYAHILSLHFDRESFFTNLSAGFINNSAITSPICTKIVKILEGPSSGNAANSQSLFLLNFPCTVAYSTEFGTMSHKSPLYYEFPNLKEEIVNLKIFSRVAKEMLAMSSCLSPLAWHYLSLCKLHEMKICLHETTSRRLSFNSLKKNTRSWVHHYKCAKKYLNFESKILSICNKKSDSLNLVEKTIKSTSKDLTKVPFDRLKTINLELLV